MARTIGPVEKTGVTEYRPERPRWGFLDEMAVGESVHVTGYTKKAMGRVRERQKAGGKPVRIIREKDGYRITRI